MGSDRFERLTEGQRACLRLVYDHREIKEIARTLDISVPTVNQRLAAARRILGAMRSIDAARLLAEHERGDALYTPPIYTPAHIAVERPDPAGGLADRDGGPNEPGAGVERGGRSLVGDDRPAPEPGFGWPFPTRSRARNDLSLWWRICWVFLIAFGGIVAFGLLVSSLVELSRIV